MIYKTVYCFICNKAVKRIGSVVDYRAKLGMRTFCSRKCASKGTKNRHKPSKGVRHPNTIVPHTLADEYTPFRHILGRTKSKRRSKGCFITLKDLKDLWEKQNGICPYTGWKLELPSQSRTRGQDYKLYMINRASLDRLDSSKPYTKDNIQFVSLIAQYAKNQFSEEQFIKFCIDAGNHLRLHGPERFR